MISIGKGYGWVTFYILIALSIIPVISFFGHFFTKDGRELLKINPFMILYYIIFFTYAYFFWMYPGLIYDFLGINGIYQKMIYGSLCVIPMLERGIPN